MQTRNRVFRLSGGVICVLVAVFMAIPAITVAVLSFAGGSNLVFPPTSWGLTQYHTAFTNGVWIPAIYESLKIGIPVSVLAVAVGVPAALAPRVQRRRATVRRRPTRRAGRGLCGRDVRLLGGDWDHRFILGTGLR